jgi:hypothetical protein
MKTSLLFLVAIPAFLTYWNNHTEITNPVAENPLSISKKIVAADELAGQWKKVAGGEDANKNRVLDEAEIIKNPEPGAQDNLHFTDDGKCRVFGMGMELQGSYRVKNMNGKKMILINHNETSANLPEEKKTRML